MSRPSNVSDISYAAFRERVPNIGQQARIGIKVVDLIYKNGLANLRDLIAPKDKPDEENRMSFVARRASERENGLGLQVESYILDKGFGTETARAIIRHRQEHPEQAQPQERMWVP